MTDSYQENESAVCQPTTNQADKETDAHAEWKTPGGDNQPSVCLKEGGGNSRDLHYCVCVCVFDTARKSDPISSYSTAQTVSTSSWDRLHMTKCLQ